MKTLDPATKAAFVSKGFKLTQEMEDKIANVTAIDWKALLLTLGAAAVKALLAFFGVNLSTNTALKASCPAPDCNDGCQCCCCAAHHFALAAACCSCHCCDGDSCDCEKCKQEAVCHVIAGLNALMTPCCG